jgi:hypothetical protein
VGAGTSQSIFHVSTLEQFLEGRITAEEWSKNVMEFSVLLFEAGLELGRIVMSKEVQPPEASAIFAKTLRGLHQEIAKKSSS